MAVNGLQADLLNGVQHGFFTRQGGASSGIFRGLNCGRGSTDQAEMVTINRARVADAMRVAPNLLKSVHQHHSAKVITVNADSDTGVMADGMVTDQPGIALGVLSADCQPVLFYDAKAQVISATHAGWKGAKLGVLQNTVSAMEQLGAHADDITAVIGPCISQAAYEVGPEFFDAVCDNDPEASQYFAGGTGDRMMFNLPRYGLAQLRAAGITTCAWTGHCTYGDSFQFFSYRRSVHEKQADYGRLISCIRL